MSATLKDGTVKAGLAKPGDLITADFRENKKPTCVNETIRVVVWNIERGYKLQEIVADLKKLDGDILLLQEIDINCERSGWKDTGVEIARALKLNYAFACEFEELYHSDRKPHQQGGGIHGNCIMTKYDMEDISVIQHKYAAHNWDDPDEGMKKFGEPRHGRRVCIGASIVLPEGTKGRGAVSPSNGRVRVYSAHLENFSGMITRLKQFSDIMEDACKFAGPQVIGGDLNTLAHGIARLSPTYWDAMTLWSLGYAEAEWWQKHVFGKGKRWLPSGVNMPENPGFQDPFHKRNDITIVSHNGWFTGKLDWCLLQNLHPVNYKMGNLDSSDHKYLCADVTFKS